MKILVSKAPNSLREHWDHPAFGVLVTPRMGGDMSKYVERPIVPIAYPGIVTETYSGWTRPAPRYWAMDNEAYSDWNAERFTKAVERVASIPGCRWVALPDVVGDATETLVRFYDWLPYVSSFGLPVALVAQDGLVPADVPWSLIDCLFIGGTTEFKLGEGVRELVRIAKDRGKLVHMGRVNSRRRLRYAKSIGCDSVDGTKYSRFSDTWLADDLEFAAIDGQLAW